MDLHFCHCSFVRFHRTLRYTPAMEAGLPTPARPFVRSVKKGDNVR